MIDNEIIELLNECDTTHIKIRCVESIIGDTRDVIHLDLSKIVDILNRKNAEIERLNKQLGELKFLESRVKSIKNTPKDTLSGALISIAEGVARYETIKEFEERAIKNICEKVYAPTPVQSCIVEKCNQVIVETAKEVVGEG